MEIGKEQGFTVWDYSGCVKLRLHIIYDLIKLIIIRIKYADLHTIYCL